MAFHQRGGGGNAHAALGVNNAPFNGYVPRREGIVNPALFACYLDRKFLEAGEVVAVVGSCEALHGWDFGVELEQDPANPNLWMRKVVMPFDKNERCYSGIFQFQFAIRSANGTQIWHEGGDRRTVHRMVPSFFGSFRYTKRVARFASTGVTPPSNFTVAREFLLQALNAYEDNPEVFSARDVLEQYSGVDRAFEPTPQVAIAATDDHIAAVAGVRGGCSDVAILLGTAMVGSAAESTASREQADAAALASELEDAGMSMAEQIEMREEQLAIAAVARAEERRRGTRGDKSATVPAPLEQEPVTPWCIRALRSAIEARDGWENVLEELLPPRPDIPEDGGVGVLLEEQMELLMRGSRDAKPHWCESAVGNGLRLAIARVGHENGQDYRWLTSSPLLNRSRLVSGGGHQSTVPEPKERFSTSTDITDAFLKATNEVFNRIDLHREKLLAQPPITFGDFGMGGGGAGAGNLVAAMRAMGGAGGAHLLRPVETWMSTEGAGPRGQGKSDSVVMLEYLFRYAPNFQVVYELLRRCYYHKYGKEGLFNHALTGAARWIGSFPWSTTSEVKELTDTLRDRIPPLRTPAVAASVLRKECIDGMCASSEGLQEVLRLIHTCVGDQPAAYGGPAIAATRGWFKRRHGGPADGGQGQDAMLPRILAALHELNSLLTIPCFARDPHVLADELEFLKTAGDRRHTIELLAQIAKHYGDMPPSITTPVLCRLLKNKASTTIADYFNSDRSAVRARWIVEVLTSAIPATPSTTTPGVCFTPTVLGNFLSLIFSRAVQRNRTLVPHEYFVGADDLPSVLGFHSALAAGLSWATSASNVDAVRGTALDSLLAKCLAAIRQLAHELHSRKIFLGSLRAVLRQPMETLALVDAASPTDLVSQGMLEEYRETLVNFDFELEAVQYFLTSYCNDGDRTVYRVPTNVSRLKDAVDEVAGTLSHDGYQLLDIHGGATIAAVAEVLARFGAVPKLHTLRNSEIFRELWQASGEDVRRWPAPPAELLNRAPAVQEKILAAIPPPGNKAAVDYFANPKHHASTDKTAGASPGHWWRKANVADGKAGQKRLENLPLNLSAKELSWLDCVSALAQEADDTWTRGPSNGGFLSPAGRTILKVHGFQPTFAGAHRPLHALHVQYLWLPLVLRRWATLQKALFDRSACIDSLEITFGQLRTGDLRASCVRELTWILGLGDESQVDPAIKRGVSDFVRLKQLRPQLSSLVNLFKSLSKADGSASTENDDRSEAIDNDLLSLPPGADKTVEMLCAADNKLSLEWTPEFSPVHTLQTIGSLLDPVRGVAEALSPSQSEFLALLGENPVLVLWLRRYRDQDEFDNKLQVARGLGSITEPELISAIESLKRVRVALRSILYVDPDHRHTSFLQFLQRFAENVAMSAHSLGDMKSLGVVGERLLEVLDKQTKGAGVRNCYELVDIHVKGKFALVASQIKDDVLLLRVAGAPDRKLAYLQDLRAKLMMTEISAELDSETATEPNAKAGVKALLEAFASQLEVLERIRDQIHALCCAGHYTYQAGHEQTFDFRDVSAEALKRLEETYAENELELVHWNDVVDKARESCFFLNYFTMQELWALRARIIAVFETAKEAADAMAKSSADPSAKKLKDKADRRRAKKAQAIADVKTMFHLVVSSSEVVEVAVNCMTSDAAQTVTSEVCGPVDPSSPGHILLAIGNLLELCFPGAKAASSHRKLSKLDQSVENASDMLVSLRDVSSGTGSGGSSKNVSEVSASAVGSSSEEHPIWISTAPDPEQPGMTLDMVLSVFVRRGRLPEPGEIVFCEPSTTTEELKLLLRRFISAGANHRRDFIFCLVNVDKLPYTEQVTLGKMMKHFLDTYGTANASGLLILSGQPDQHIVNAWSAYRVAASPLRAEILQQKCAEAFEDRREGRGGSLLRCVRSTINGGGKTHFVLSAAAAAQTSATAAGTGEVKYFRFGYRENTTAGLLVQKLTSKLKFSHTSQSTVDSKPHSHFVHLDVGHVVPRTTNTVLFQLFFVGVISDQASGQIYHRDSSDTYMVEMANSPAVFELLRICRFLPGFEAPLTIGPDFLRFQRPRLSGKITYNRRGQRRGEMVSVDIESNDLLRHVCRVLKALDQGSFRQGEPSFVEKLNFNDIPVEPSECFSLICKHCGLAPPGSVTPSDIEEKSNADDEPDALRQPGTGNGQHSNAAAIGGAPADNPQDELDAASWTVVSNFVNYIGAQFRGLEGHRGWCTFPGLVNTCGVTTLRLFRHQFLLLLLETTRDFAKRAVPRGRQFLGGTSGAGAVPSLSRQLSLHRQMSSSSTSSLGPRRQLSRQSSASDRARVASTVAAARERAEQEAIENAVLSCAIAGFEKMKNWEDTDHPIAVLYPVLGDKSRTQNFTLFALNRAHTARFIPKEMADAVQQQLQIDLSKDWSKITDAEGRRTISRLAGIIGIQDLKEGGKELRRLYDKQEAVCLTCLVEKADQAPPGYVMTVDNMAKMLSIYNRMITHLPVIIMGETGCGKSSLIRQMCALIKAPLRTLNIHGGMGDRQIIDWMWAQFKEFRQADIEENGGRFIVFLDEVNTCNSMALFKEILCDRMLEGMALPESFIVVAACNPYRRRKQTIDANKHLEAGLKYQPAAAGTGEAEAGVAAVEEIDMKDLVYRVFPLPESMMDHVYDFGALDATTEQLYIEPKISKHLKHRPRVKTAKQVYIESGKGCTAEQWAELSDAQRKPFEAIVADAKLEATQRRRGFLALYAALICAAQEFVREQNGGERSSASLRDVDRCAQIFRWFGEHLAAEFGEEEEWTLEDFLEVRPVAQRHVRTAVIMSIAYCYHARLDRKLRQGLRDRLSQCRASLLERYEFDMVSLTEKHTRAMKSTSAQTDQELQATHGLEQRALRLSGVEWLDLSSASFMQEVERVQTYFVSNMKVGDGIARNEALCENLFMILVSVLNKIPIFVIGVPGSSKSLAMRLIQSNLRGSASSNEFLRKLPAVEVFPYQCSPQSTSQGIEQVFGSANRVAAEAQNTVVVVLLDEVGLAEYSPHLPLKVLHKLLDEAHGSQALVGISNWPLDPAKMNRAVHLYRPAPTAADLAVTASGIVESESLRPYLKALASAYHDVVEQQREQYRNETQADFWGLREFYSLVKKINFDIRRLRAAGEAEDLHPQQLLFSIQRNFGGRPSDMEPVLRIFFERLGKQQLLAELQRMPVLELVRENLGAMQESRHLMILTKNNATTALSLLYDNGLVDHENSEVIFGSDFPHDDSDLQIILNLQRIKKCMAEGRTVVLVHSRDGFYETLYDLLNQNYTEHGGQLYARLAFGNSYVLCPLVKEFRVVVIVDQADAYTKLAPPLLNRFEKQVLTRQHLLGDDRRSQRVRDTVHRLKAFVHSFATVSFVDAEAIAAVDGDPAMVRDAFCGYHKDMLLSLAQSMELESLKAGSNTATAAAPKPQIASTPLQQAIRRLLWCATPEAASRWMADTEAVRAAAQQVEAEFGIDIEKIYFQDQQHSNLPTFVRTLALRESASSHGSPTIDGTFFATENMAAATVALTFAPFHHDTAALVNAVVEGVHAVEVTLHQLSSEHDLRSEVAAFCSGTKDGIPAACNKSDAEISTQLLIIHCDPTVASAQRVEHAKYIVEQERAAQSAAEAAAAGALKGVSRHILLLVHLPRGQAGQLIPVDFNKRWKYAFVDAIDSSDTNGMPDMQELLTMNSSMHVILKNLDLDRVFRSVFRSALANLKLPFRCGTEFYLHKIHSLQKLVEATCTDAEPRFLAFTREIMCKVMETENMSLNMNLSGRSDLLLRGTFQNCLHAQILAAARRALTVLLAHAERNSYLALLDVNALASLSDPERSHLSNLWYRLFRKSCPKEIEEQAASANSVSQAMVVVKMDSRQTGTRFEAHFPFSHFVARLVETHRSIFVPQLSNESLVTLETNLRNQVCALHRLELSLASESTTDMSAEPADDELQPSLEQRYLRDFVMMFVLDDEHREVDAGSVVLPVTRKVLQLATGTTPSHPSDIHIRFWKYEDKLRQYLRLLNSLPNNRQQIVRDDLCAVADKSLIASNNPEVALDVRVLSLVLAQLESMVADEAIEPATWLRTFHDMEELVVQIMDDGITALTTVDEPSNGSDSGRLAVEALCVRWEKLSLFAMFLRDVTIPLAPALGVQQTHKNRTALWAGMSAPDESIRSHRFFDSIFGLLRDVSAVTDASSTASAFSRFIDVYISEYVFASPIASQTQAAQSKVDHDLFKDVIGLLSKDSMTIANGGEAAATALSLSLPESSRLSLMRTVLDVQEPSVKAKVDEFLEAALPWAVAGNGFLDEPLCVCYVYVCEGMIHRKLQAHSGGDNIVHRALLLAQQFQLEQAPLLQTPLSPEKVAASTGRQLRDLLDAIATARALYDIAADLLFKDPSLADLAVDQSPGATLHTDSAELVRVLNRCLVPTNTAESSDGGTTAAFSQSSYLQSLQIYLLKGLERRGGLSFLRGVLAKPAVGAADWCVNGLKRSAVAHPHFTRWTMGSNLPTSNPMRDHRGAESMSIALDGFLQTEAATDLEGTFVAAARKFLTDEPWGEAYLPGALLVAVFHKCYYLRAQALDMIPPQTRERVALLHEWLGSSGQAELKLPDLVLSMLLRFTTLDVSVDELQAKSHDAFYLGPNSTTNDILKTRVLVHMVAVASMGLDKSIAGVRPLLAFFTSVLYHPEKLNGSYFPQMPMDHLYYMMCNMRFAETGKRGRWMYCRNGHPYCVDACGRPTIVQKCSACGVLIGGLGHDQIEYIGDWNLGVHGQYGDPPELRPKGEVQKDRDVDPALQGNTNYYQVSTPQDNSAPQYCLTKAEEGSTTLADVSESLREVPARDCRAQRLLLHAALLAGAHFGGSAWLRKAANFSKAIEPNSEGLPTLFAGRFMLDWERMKKVLGSLGDDDTELILHAAITGFGEAARTAVERRLQPHTPSSAFLASRESRAMWERNVHKSILADIVADGQLSRKLATMKELYDDENEHRVGIMLQERALATYDTAERARAAPALFRFRQAFAADTFEFHVHAARERFPLLHSFVTEPDQVRGAHYLADALDWMRLLTTQYNRRIAEKTAEQEIKVADVLAAYGQAVQWQRAWQGFEAAWALEAHLGVPIECGTITPEGIAMGLDSQLALCLPAHENQGLLTKALATILTRLHNNLRELAQEHLVARGGGVVEPSQVSSRNFTRTHTIHKKRASYEAAFAAFTEYVKRHCLVYSTETGKLTYDLAAAERWLVDEYFATCPTVKLELNMVSYLGESAISDALLSLKRTIPQEPLPMELKAQLKRTVTNRTIAQSCIEELEQALVIMVDSIVQAEVGGNTKLWSVLMLQNDIFNDIRLKHVDALNTFLAEQVSTSEFPLVHKQYKVKFTDGFNANYHSFPAPSQEAVQNLHDAARRAEGLEVIVECMLELMESYLMGTNVDPSTSIRDAVMADFDEELEGTDFDLLFPEGEGSLVLNMGHFIEAYKVLDQAHNFAGDV